MKDGVLTDVVWDRTTAKRAGDGRESTGHAPPSSLRHWGPLPFALSVSGGEAASGQELAELVDDGIYVTRLHYLSIVDAREGVITGMTRDPVLLNQSAYYDERYPTGMLSPAVATARFDVTGVGSGPGV